MAAHRVGSAQPQGRTHQSTHPPISNLVPGARSTQDARHPLGGAGRGASPPRPGLAQRTAAKHLERQAQRCPQRQLARPHRTVGHHHPQHPNPVSCALAAGLAILAHLASPTRSDGLHLGTVKLAAARPKPWPPSHSSRSRWLDCAQRRPSPANARGPELVRPARFLGTKLARHRPAERHHAPRPSAMAFGSRTELERHG